MAWGGVEGNVAAAKTHFFNVAKANSEATLGQYRGGALSAESLVVRNYIY